MRFRYEYVSIFRYFVRATERTPGEGVPQNNLFFSPKLTTSSYEYETVTVNVHPLDTTVVVVRHMLLKNC